VCLGARPSSTPPSTTAHGTECCGSTSGRTSVEPRLPQPSPASPAVPDSPSSVRQRFRVRVWSSRSQAAGVRIRTVRSSGATASTTKSSGAATATALQAWEPTYSVERFSLALDGRPPAGAGAPVSGGDHSVSPRSPRRSLPAPHQPTILGSCGLTRSYGGEKEVRKARWRRGGRRVVAEPVLGAECTRIRAVQALSGGLPAGPFNAQPRARDSTASWHDNHTKKPGGELPHRPVAYDPARLNVSRAVTSSAVKGTEP
jgi:hypothetical protein